jgi:hypothetical protein
VFLGGTSIIVSEDVGRNAISPYLAGILEERRCQFIATDCGVFNWRVIDGD